MCIERIHSISCHPLPLTHYMLPPFNPGSAVYPNTALHQSEEEVQEYEMHFCYLLNDSLEQILAGTQAFSVCLFCCAGTSTHTFPSYPTITASQQHSIPSLSSSYLT